MPLRGRGGEPDRFGVRFAMQPNFDTRVVRLSRLGIDRGLEVLPRVSVQSEHAPLKIWMVVQHRVQVGSSLFPPPMFESDVCFPTALLEALHQLRKRDPDPDRPRHELPRFCRSFLSALHRSISVPGGGGQGSSSVPASVRASIFSRTHRHRHQDLRCSASARSSYAFVNTSPTFPVPPVPLAPRERAGLILGACRHDQACRHLGVQGLPVRSPLRSGRHDCRVSVPRIRERSPGRSYVNSRPCRFRPLSHPPGSAPSSHRDAPVQQLEMHAPTVARSVSSS